jgi:hypothetical protein
VISATAPAFATVENPAMQTTMALELTIGALIVLDTVTSSTILAMSKARTFIWTIASLPKIPNGSEYWREN